MTWTPPDWCVAAKSVDEKVRLEVHNHETDNKTCHLVTERGFYTLGRENQDIKLTGEWTSRRHAVILRSHDGRWFIQDLKSTGGTWMDSHRLEPWENYELTPGTDVTLGQHPKHDLIRLVPESPVQAKRNTDSAQRVPKRSREPLEVAQVDQSSSSHELLPQARTRNPEEPVPAAKRRCVQRENCNTTSIKVGSGAPRAACGTQSASTAAPSSNCQPVRRSDSVRLSTSNGTTCQARPVQTAKPNPAVQSAPAKKCDKCDGPHLTDACPHFRKAREDHKDAWVNYGRKHPLKMGNSGGNFMLRYGRPVRQPGDGDCLFHSLCFGLNDHRPVGLAARELRRELARFVERNPKIEISGDTLEQWVAWDANTSVSNYARRMAVSGWGGGIEMAVCSLVKKVNVHVYESKASGFKRISCFDCPEPAKRTIHVLYQGGVHFDALVPK